MDLAVIVLAAGRGTRMASDRPKVLHQIGGAPLLQHALASAAPLSPARTIVVTGERGDAVAAAVADIAPGAELAEQTERRGTAHAVAQARGALRGFRGDVLVLYGDTPFITTQTLQRMTAARQDGADLVVLGFRPADPGRYGRILADGTRLQRIVEWKDADPAERAVDLCNSGVMLAPASDLFDWIDDVGADNAAGEYYLTDIAGIATAGGRRAEVVICPPDEPVGINTRAELAAAEAAFQARARAAALAAGATLRAPETVHFAHDTVLGRDAVVEPYVVFGPGVTVEPGATVRAFSHLEAAHVSAGAELGPFARLRPGAELAERARVGNFVEVKNATIGPGAKVNHLSYVGDASVGAGANLGAGTITCNYDGLAKHRTRIGERAFIGSSTMLVAPVSVGAEAMTAAGSVITEDVPEGALSVARGRQVTKPGLAVKLMARLRAARARLTEGGG